MPLFRRHEIRSKGSKTDEDKTTRGDTTGMTGYVLPCTPMFFIRNFRRFEFCKYSQRRRKESSLLCEPTSRMLERKCMPVYSSRWNIKIMRNKLKTSPTSH